jgi:hypothetical protein
LNQQNDLLDFLCALDQSRLAHPGIDGTKEFVLLRLESDNCDQLLMSGETGIFTRDSHFLLDFWFSMYTPHIFLLSLID